MLDMHGIVGGAQTIHQVFESLFYAIITSLLLLGVILEYFKLPLGGTPAFGLLVGRVLIAVLLLGAYPEISNLLASLSDALTSQFGDLNNFKLVLSKMGDKLKGLTVSWVSVKDTILLAITFLTFFLLYAAVYFVEAMSLYAWVILYTFSPILIALYVLPATAQATNALFRSLIEVSIWKVVFSIMATLLWSSALSDLNQPGSQISFVTVIIYNLFLAASILMTPVIVHALAGAGVSGIARTLGSAATTAAVAAPSQVLGVAGLPKTAAARFSARAWNAYKDHQDSARPGTAGPAHRPRRVVQPISKPYPERKSAPPEKRQIQPPK